MNTDTHTRSVNGGFSSSERDELGSGKLYLPSPHPVSDSDLNPLGEEGKKHNAAPTTHRVHVSHHCFAACLVSLSLCPSLPCLVILGTTSAPLSLSLAVSVCLCLLHVGSLLCALFVSCALSASVFISISFCCLYGFPSPLSIPLPRCVGLSRWRTGSSSMVSNEGIHQGVRGS